MCSVRRASARDVASGGGRKSPLYGIAGIDKQMPEMDGLALAQKINADSGLSATRLVMLTPFGKPTLRDELPTADIAACCVPDDDRFRPTALSCTTKMWAQARK